MGLNISSASEDLTVGSMFAVGSVLVQYDGPDETINLSPTGLAGVSLGGGAPGDPVLTGSGLHVATHAIGVSDDLVIRIYTDATSFSTYTLAIPVSDTFVEEFVPFSNFTPAGVSGADFNDVGAIEASINLSSSNAARILIIDTRAPDVQTVQLPNIQQLAGAPTDLQITKTADKTQVTEGDPITYTMVVTNAGPTDVVGATVIDTFPPELTNVSWTASVTQGSGTVSESSGAGDIDVSIDLTDGSEIIFTVTADIVGSLTADQPAAKIVTNTAQVEYLDDSDPSNNRATDGDVVVLAVSNLTTGLFAAGDSLGDSSSQDVSLGDLDGDGDLDAFVPVVNYVPNRVWLNDGNGNFTSGASLGDSSSQDVGLGDLDGDGDLDAFVANIYGPNRVWINDGDGNFDESSNRLGDSFSRGVSLGDVDGDGDLDAFAANSTRSTPVIEPNRVWLNDGVGNFTDSGNRLGDSWSFGVSLGDLDGDGDLDAFVANTSSEPDQVWLNGGADLRISKTAGATQVTEGDSITYTIVVTNDGPNDVIGATVTDTFPPELTGVTWEAEVTGTGTVSESSGTGDIGVSIDLEVDSEITFTVTADVVGPLTANQPAAKIVTNTARVDYLGDSDPSNNSATDGDIVVLAVSNPTSGLFAPGDSLGDSNSLGVSLGDLDGDGDLDAFVANSGVTGMEETNRVWLNDGNGTFTARQELGDSLSEDVSLGDLDGDGDLDALVANGGPNRVWLNDGNGNFADSGDGLGNAVSKDVSLGDVDGDGDLDAFVANIGFTANRVWLNDGNGNFSDSGSSLGDSFSYEVSLGDLDGDGDLDAFVANARNTISGADGPNRVWLNDGDGNFSDSGNSLGDSFSFGVSLGDLDGDGDLDAFVTNESDDPNQVWINGGADLRISKTATPDPVNAGTQLVYEIVVANDGPDEASDVVVMDALPAGVMFVSGDVDGDSGAISFDLASNTVTGAIGTLSKDAPSTIIITVIVPPGWLSPLSNTATVTATPDNDPVRDNNESTVNTAVDRVVDLAIDKSIDGDAIAGSLVTYTIQVDNTGPGDARGVTVIDTLVDELTFDSFDPGSSGVMISLSGQELTLDVDTLPVNESRTFSFTAMLSSSAIGNLSNTATVTTTDDDNNPDNNSDTDDATVERQIDLILDKSVNLTTAVPGQDSLQYALDISHDTDSVSDAINIVVTDILPEGLTGTQITAPGSSSAVYDSATRTVTVTYATIPIAQTQSFTVVSAIEERATGSLVNDAAVTSDGEERDDSNNMDSETTNLTPQFDLTVTKTVDDPTPNPGQTITYDLQVPNSGPSTATGVVLTDPIPAGLTFVSGTLDGQSGTNNSGTIEFPSMTVASGASLAGSLVFTVNNETSGIVTNTASVTADPGETDTGNNSGSDNIDVTPIVDLAITKSVDLTENAQAGTELTYSITVTSGGPSPATSVQAVDTLPAGVTFVSGVGPNGEQLTESGGMVTVDGGRMVGGDEFSFTIIVSVDSGATGTLENRVTVDSDVDDPDSSNNTATASTTVDPVNSQIAGTVFYDLNANGMFDPGEHRIRGVMMMLVGTDALGNTVERMVMTDDNGEYLFGSLPAGIYDVIQRQPIGFRNGQLEPGSGATATTGENEFLDLMLDADTVASDWNFGELRQRLSKRRFLASYLGSIVKSR